MGKDIKYFNIFKKVNELIAKKSYKYTLHFIVLLLFIFLYLKANDVSFDSIRSSMKKISSKLDERQGDLGVGGEEAVKKMQRKLNLLRKEKDKDREKREEEIKQVDVKKEIVPETETEIAEQMKITEEKKQISKNIKEQIKVLEEQISSPVSIFAKLQKLDDKYKERVEKKWIKHGRTIKIGDVVYYSMSITNTINYDGSDRVVEGEGARIFVKIDNADKMSQFFIGKKIGNTFVIEMKDILDRLDSADRDKINESINDSLVNKDPKLEGINVNIMNFKYKIKVLDIVPKAIINELELDI
jgi:hypothetical protein